MSGPVVTVTLNPAIDQTITLDRLVPGAVHRAREVRFDAGGKGVNVAACLADWGVPASATGVLGDANDRVFKALFAAKRIDDRFFRVPGETRVNIKLVHDAATTDINLPGLVIPLAVRSALTEKVLSLAGEGSLVVLSGSVPAGIGPAVYRVLTAALAERGARVVLDASGEPLAAALRRSGGPLPYCVKPNRSEFEALIGHPLPTVESLARAAKGLLAQGLGLVVVSLGQDGALFADPARGVLASLPPIACASTVGAGDAMVAGIVAALRDGLPLEAMARLATAFAAAKLGQVGPNLPARAEVLARAAEVGIAAVDAG